MSIIYSVFLNQQNTEFENLTPLSLFTTFPAQIAQPLI